MLNCVSEGWVKSWSNQILGLMILLFRGLESSLVHVVLSSDRHCSSVMHDWDWVIWGGRMGHSVVNNWIVDNCGGSVMN